MILAAALISRLIADSAVAAIVSDRIYWVYREQGKALPAVVLQQISRQRPDLLDGEEDMLTSRIQIDCFSLRYAEATALAAAVRRALIDEATVGNVLFWRADFDGPRDLGEQTDAGFVHRMSMDMNCRHTAGDE